MSVNTIMGAALRAKEIIEKNLQDDIAGMQNVHGGKHMLLHTKKGLLYYVLYKREVFLTFGKQFGFVGAGESINEEQLEFAVEHGASAILIVYENGHLYSLGVQEWKDFALKNNTIRQQHNGVEITYSVPLSMLRRWK